MVIAFISEKPVNVILMAVGENEPRPHGYVLIRPKDPRLRAKGLIERPFRLDLPRLVARGVGYHTHRRLINQFRHLGVDPVEFRLDTPYGVFRYTTDYKDKLNTPEQKNP